ncbi:hypothetical protein B0H10DRAFT_2027336 [Mycena sp. CBHHK59/15]|nr:hypothetical protein B0H10DRAFT_2027336 [Mycena sp. CBHHK59/15]
MQSDDPKLRQFIPHKRSREDPEGTRNDSESDTQQNWLQIRTDFSPDILIPSSPGHSPNSLFSDFDERLSVNSASSTWADQNTEETTPALVTVPPIPGLFFTPFLRLPQGSADQVVQFCLENYFGRPGVNQIMLFGRATVASSPHTSPDINPPSSDPDPSGLPPILLSLLSEISSLLQPSLPQEIHALLFPLAPTLARQAILNLYNPGEGIKPHVDLLKRFGDGIVGISLGSSCVMKFARVEETEQSLPLNLFLPERSLIVLSGDARYYWTHGIEKRTTDLVADADSQTGFRVVERGVRLSITFRWLLPGADIVGQEESDGIGQ